MELKFSPSVAQIQKVSYAKEAEEKFLLDCGDGCSPYGCSEKVAQALREADIHDVAAYPHGFELKDAIIRRWQKYAPLTYDMLYLHNSGMDAIACVNTIFSRTGAAGEWARLLRISSMRPKRSRRESSRMRRLPGVARSDGAKAV